MKRTVHLDTLKGLPGKYLKRLSSFRDVFMGTLAGFGSAVYSALQIERAENVIDQSGMKYLALADYKLRR